MKVIFRSSRLGVFCRKDVLRNFGKFTGKHLCLSLFFNKVVGLRPATLLKKRLWHKCFPVNFVKFLRTPFLQNTSGRLLLSRYLMARQSESWLQIQCLEINEKQLKQNVGLSYFCLFSRPSLLRL